MINQIISETTREEAGENLSSADQTSMGNTVRLPSEGITYGGEGRVNMEDLCESQ